MHSIIDFKFVYDSALHVHLRGLSHGEAHIVVASSPQPLSGGLNDTGITDEEARRLPHLRQFGFYTSTPKNL